MTTRPRSAKRSCLFELRNIVLFPQQDYALSISCAASYSEALFLDTPSLAVPRFVYVLVSAIKLGTSQVSGRASRTASCRREHLFHHRSGNSHWISCGLSDFALTQFHLPVVTSIVKHHNFR